MRGDYVDPKTVRVTIDEWCGTWLAGYGSRRTLTARQAEDEASRAAVAAIAAYTQLRALACEPAT